MALQENFSIKAFTAIRNELFDSMNEAIGDNNALKPSISIDQIETKFALLTSRVFSTRPWPDTLWPMNDMRVFLSRLYEHSNNSDQAAIFSLRGWLATTRRSEPNWVCALNAILMLL